MLTLLYFSWQWVSCGGGELSQDGRGNGAVGHYALLGRTRLGVRGVAGILGKTIGNEGCGEGRII